MFELLLHCHKHEVRYPVNNLRIPVFIQSSTVAVDLQHFKMNPTTDMNIHICMDPTRLPITQPNNASSRIVLALRYATYEKKSDLRRNRPCPGATPAEETSSSGVQE